MTLIKKWQAPLHQQQLRRATGHLGDSESSATELDSSWVLTASWMQAELGVMPPAVATPSRLKPSTPHLTTTHLGTMRHILQDVVVKGFFWTQIWFHLSSAYIWQWLPTAPKDEVQIPLQDLHNPSFCGVPACFHSFGHPWPHHFTINHSIPLARL